MQNDSRQIIERLYEGFRTRDMATIFGLLSPEVEIVQSEELPWGGTYRGHDEARQFFGKLGANLNSTLTLERFVHAGDHIVAIGWTSGTVNGSGAKYHVAIAHVWQVRDGKIVAAKFYIDNPEMLKALG